LEIPPKESTEFSQPCWANSEAEPKVQLTAVSEVRADNKKSRGAASRTQRRKLSAVLCALAPLTLLMVSVAAPKQFWERLLALAGGVIVLVVANAATIVVTVK